MFYIMSLKSRDGRSISSRLHIPTAMQATLYLIEHGNAVTLVGRPDRLAPKAYPTQVRDITKYLVIANTVFMTSTALESIEDGYIRIRDMKTGTVSILPADCVVLALGVRSALPYGKDLEDLRCVRVGDAIRSGGILEAVQTGFDAVVSLGQ